MLSALNRNGSFYWRQYGFEQDKKSRRVASACLTAVLFAAAVLCFWQREQIIALQTGKQETVVIMRSFVPQKFEEKKMRKILAQKSSYEIPREPVLEKKPAVRQETVKPVKPVKAEKPLKRREPKPQKAAAAKVQEKSVVQHAVTQASSVQAVGSSEAAKVSESTLLANILREIEKHKKYPRKARKKRVEGTSRLIVSMDGRGVVADVSLHQSSGAKILDNASLETGRKLIGFDTGAGRSVSVIVPITYSLKR